MNLRLPLLLISALASATLVGGCGKQTQVDRAVARGNEKMQAGDYEQAEKEYLAALELIPDFPKAAGRLGILYYAQGRIVPAYLLLKESLKLEPENPEVRLNYGWASRTLAKTADAREAARKVLESQPTNEDALLLLVDTCVTSRDTEEARRIVEQLRDKNGANAGYHLALGALSLGQREFDGAEAELLKARTLNPKSANAVAVLGSIYSARGDTARAGEAWKTASEMSPLRSPRRIKFIEHLIQTGANADAKKELIQITNKAPDYIIALNLEMNLAFNERRFDDSLAAADKILKRDRTNHDAMSQRAVVKYAQGDMDATIRALMDMEATYAGSPLIKYRLARAHLRKGDNGLAEENLLKAIQLSPNYDDAILALAELNLQRGNAAATVGALTTLLKRNPRVARAYIVLGQAYQAQGKLDESLKILRTYSEATPKSPEGPYRAALVLNQLNQKDEARSSLEQAVQREEDYWPAVEMLVSEDLAAKRTSAAKERVERLIAKYPARAEPVLLRAKIRMLEGDTVGAQPDLLKGIELNPDIPQGYVNLSRIYLQSKQTQQAIDTVTALAAKTNKASTYMQLGILHGTVANYEGARAAYEKALSIDGKFVPALNNLASLLSESPGQLDKALVLATQGRDLAPSDPHVTDTLGWILYLKGQYANALPLFKISAEKMPAEPLIQYHLGMVCYKLGQEESSRQALRVAVGAELPAAAKMEAQDRLAILDLDSAKGTAAVRKDLEARVQREPNDVVVLNRLAAIEARDGAIDRAVAHYEAALKINPKAVRTLVALVPLYAGPAANPSRAKELARLAYAAAPNDGELAWALGRTAFGLGDHVWAATVLQGAARALPERGEVVFEAAQANFSVGRVNEAEKALQEGLRGASLVAKRAEAQRLASMIAAAKSRTLAHAAVAEAQKILATDPEYVPALQVSALAQEHAKDYKGAQKIYDKILTRYPQFTPAIRQLALLHAEHLGDDKTAEELANKVRQSFPEDPELAYALGTISYRRGDYAEAVKMLTQSSRRREPHAQTFFFLGMAQFQLKNATESRAQLERALQANLPPQEASEAKRLLEQLGRGEKTR